MKLNKIGFVSLTTFSVVILLLTSLVLFSIQYNNYAEESSNKLNSERELLNSIFNFRSQIVEITSNINTNLTYVSKLDSGNIQLELKDDIIIGTYIESDYYVILSEPSLLNFCSDFEFHTIEKTTFNYNGSCINKIS